MQRIGLFARYKRDVYADVTVPGYLPSRTTGAELGGNVARFLFKRAGYDRAPFRLDEEHGRIFAGNECVLRVVARPGDCWDVWQAPGIANFAPGLVVSLSDDGRVIKPAQFMYDPARLAAASRAFPGFVPVLESGTRLYGLQAPVFMTELERTVVRLVDGADVVVYENAPLLREALETAPACVLNAFQPGEPFADLVLGEIERRSLAAMTEGG